MGAFILHFERIARHQEWSNRKKLENCLGNSALEYADKLSSDLLYREVKKELNFRLSEKDEPVSARRELQSLRQLETESLRAQRVQTLAMDGYTDASSKTRNQIAIECFLRGCKEKDAVQKAMEKNPKSVQDALKHMRLFLANQKSLFGSKNFSHRQVNFKTESDTESVNTISTHETLKHYTKR
ncbi:hypothetical protein LOTGIDRAFT_175002 [Lottia gigantea]|uniref:Uncharacterized protein n=1 Tax=Lottia gigantea TaxID=225164 RepID=V4AQM5_LOTGI|nr:hypothetical protein LOTGIDRAFT_175002 [Lottia gigantea]ESO95981.1 hypothetical protein LOTGIDRAFT_175002 [Lottia gigantea]